MAIVGVASTMSKPTHQHVVSLYVLSLVAVAITALPLSKAAETSAGQSRPRFAPDKMETILYGVAYYPEYMPYDRLDKDVELMRQAGITVVRVGEST